MKDLFQDMLVWTESYIQSFYTSEENIQANIILKQEHTNYVIQNCKSLAKVLKLSTHDEILAMIIGLFHDIGRFKQYSIYQTFNDRLSENHALLGLKEIKNLTLLRQLSSEDREIFEFAIANHNAIEIQNTENERAYLFAKIIRDADKLDIYRVLEPTLIPSDGSGYSDKFMKSFLEGIQCDYSDIKTQDDRKLVRLLWVYNMYFAWTIRQLLARKHIENIIKCLPENEITKKGIENLNTYIKTRISLSEQHFLG
ncbi:HD domain-containing protein [Anaerosinus massiliensis]|uniref:HD domain-containing protein n=1 Tax=Massilibacillus massiliensis TaxID=1806837 RepID=UPI000A6E9DE4|nr:HD domain-containing protein [Massilibacillus massiliensis]